MYIVLCRVDCSLLKGNEQSIIALLHLTGTVAGRVGRPTSSLDFVEN